MPTPTRKLVDAIEADIGGVALNDPELRARVGDSQNMEKMNKLLSDGLTANYESGAKALEAAIQEAEAVSSRLKQEAAHLEQQMDSAKREAAETILSLKNRMAEHAATLEAYNAHLHSMTKWSEEQRAFLKAPLPKPIKETIKESTDSKLLLARAESEHD